MTTLAGEPSTSRAPGRNRRSWELANNVATGDDHQQGSRSTGRDHFLGLPVEIRTVIYEVILDQLLVPNQPHPTSGESWTPISQQQLACMKAFLSLIRTNHQIVWEVTSLFLKGYFPSLTFCFDSVASLDGLKRLAGNLLFDVHVRETRFSVRCGSITPATIRREELTLASPCGPVNVGYGLPNEVMYDKYQRDMQNLVVTHKEVQREYERRMAFFLLPTPGRDVTFRPWESEGFEHRWIEESQDGSLPGYHRVVFPHAMWRVDNTSLTLTGYRWRTGDQSRNAWDGCVVLEGKLGDVMPRLEVRRQELSMFLNTVLDQCSSMLDRLGSA